MRNIKLLIEYDGTNYCGWQIQGRNQKSEIRIQKKSVQGILEKVLARVLQEKTKLIGSGRTDAGVHARGQVANFRTKSALDCPSIQKALNSILPHDIRIEQVKPVQPQFHARFKAKSKLYCYTIVNNSFASPFQYRWCHLVKHPLDIKKMRQGSCYLIGKHNFRSFQSNDHQQRPSLRTIKRLNIRNSRDMIYLDVEADGFLYRMVRNIVGTLLEVGRGRLKPESIKQILRAKNRIYAGPCAPAKGLCLMEVRYKKDVNAI